MIKWLFVALAVSGVLYMGGVANAQTVDEVPALFDKAGEHFKKGEYREAIKIYDEILELVPENISTLRMKGIAQSNLGQHQKSLEQFYRILQYDRDDPHALAGMGVGLGYLGEYEEAQKYFDRAIKLNPESTVLQNYIEYIDRVVAKYPYTPTEKPSQLLPKQIQAEIPSWVKGNAKLWTEGQISDREFVAAMEFMIASGIVKIPNDGNLSEGKQIPSWVRESAGLWADEMAGEDEFVKALQFLIENSTIKVEAPEVQERTQEEIDGEFFQFKQYVRKITKNMLDEKRYIEFPNPSQDVIKKFLRDYVKWNFEEQAQRAATGFPDPVLGTNDDGIVANYLVYINEQPSGLPLDHVSTLRESIAFWEAQELKSSDQKVKLKFSFTNSRSEANVWVTWVVRDLGEGVLGHAHLGKGIVEVALGDYNCDGSFQLYSVESVEYIMRHELGHSVGLGHIDEPGSIMYPSYSPSYAYCLLSQ